MADRLDLDPGPKRQVLDGKGGASGRVAGEVLCVDRVDLWEVGNVGEEDGRLDNLGGSARGELGGISSAMHRAYFWGSAS